VFERSFRHEILHHVDGAAGFVRGTLPLIAHALALDAPVMVAVGRERITSLREALGDDAERVHFTDMRELGRNPARIIPMWRDFLAAAPANGDHALGVGEPTWPGRGPAESVEHQRHEALLNLAFEGGRAWHLLCPYDLDGLDDQVIEAAQRSHAFIAEDGASRPNEAYRCGHEAPMPFAGALPTPPSTARDLRFDIGTLGTLRRFVSSWGAEEMLEREPTEELVLAVNELATNSVRYGGGQGRLRVWRESSELLCEIQDAGHIEDPLVGRARPGHEENSGRGLWLVNQLCDLVQIRSSSAGTAVRVHKRLA
jgi:anti-sigma regulatory factor (Ser/Thr protein kinase)